MSAHLSDHTADAIRIRKPFKASPETRGLMAYRTKGGTYIIATDDGTDLLGVSVFGNVVVLRETVNPDLTAAVSAVFA